MKEGNSSWEQELTERVVRFVTREGALVSLRPMWYSWTEDSDELTPHLEQCAPNIPACAWKDEVWTEFVGTLHDPPTESVRGIEVLVTCSCGKIRGRTWRYTGDWATLLQGVTAPEGT